MIHVVSAHTLNDAWLPIQLEYLARFVPQPYRLYGALCGIDPKWFESYYYVSTERERHAENFNHLAGVVVEQAAPEDVVLFFDGDAFPIAPLAPLLDELLLEWPMVSVRRSENLGDRQPHPCFTATTAGFWQEIGGDWRYGYTWTNTRGDTVTDVGANVLGALVERGIDWYPLLRTNVVDLHPVFFGVYGDAKYGSVVYHHGAGFRRALTRVDLRGFDSGPPPQAIPARAWKKLRGVWIEALARRNSRLSRRVYEDVLRDREFFRRFIDEPAR